MNNTIKCKECGAEIEISEALAHQIEEEILVSLETKHKSELEEATILAEEKANIKSQKHFEVQLISLKKEKNEEKERNTRLMGQISELLDEVKKLRIKDEESEINTKKKMMEVEQKIREETMKSSDEKYRLKMFEQEKKLADTQRALEEAQRKASQGSQQNQGEVLELDLEAQLREEFPFDEIVEVKKGQRGADLKQYVRNQSLNNCGTILWETKNGKWQPAWVSKFKEDIRNSNANIGVIVSQEIPGEIGEFKNLENNVWLVKPSLATRLAVALRVTILQVDIANKMNSNKDAKMESLYQFLVGPEFKHRVEAMIEAYTNLQDEIEKEKRSYALKWARQEKSIRGIVDNTIGMYGDLQGIIGKSLPKIETLELNSGDDEEI